MNSPEERAGRRRASWTAEVVGLRAPKGALYRDLTPQERLTAFAALQARVRAATGVEGGPGPRSEWPGEIFECPTHG